MYDISFLENCYQITEKKNVGFVMYWIIILIILLLLSLYLIFNYKYSECINSTTSVIEKDGEKYVHIRMGPLTKMDLEAAKIFLNNQSVNYEIVQIDDYYLYSEILFKVQLNEESKIINLKIKMKEKTLFERIRERVG